uniref:leucine-rich repeat domain-containing protein n=1 Tax=Streptomyces sp. 142MFCol3.1 TaxID=1172179 RepID=UPI0018F880E3
MDSQELREAEQRIESVRLGGSEELALNDLLLSGDELARLIPHISRVPTVTALDLRDVDAEALPDSLGTLTSMTTLNLSGARLENVPEWIGQLTNLTTLNLSGTRLETLPEWIGQLT